MEATTNEKRRYALAALFPLSVMVPFKAGFGPSVAARAAFCTAVGSTLLYDQMFEQGIRASYFNHRPHLHPNHYISKNNNNNSSNSDIDNYNYNSESLISDNNDNSSKSNNNSNKNNNEDNINPNYHYDKVTRKMIVAENVTFLKCVGFGALVPLATMSVGAVTLPLVTSTRALLYSALSIPMRPGHINLPHPNNVPLVVLGRQVSYLGAWSFMHFSLLPIVMPIGAVLGAGLWLPFRYVLTKTLPVD